VIISWAGISGHQMLMKKHISKTVFSYKTFSTTIAETSRRRMGIAEPALPNRRRRNGIAEMS